jgi:hypothetical protein
MVSEKHLDLVQGAINRLASNSFAYKGWAATITSALIAFLLKDQPRFIVAGLYPILAFWFLDANALALERAFRKLYDQVRLGKVTEYSMDIRPYRKPLYDFLNALLSISLLVFYGTAVVCIVVMGSVTK